MPTPVPCWIPRRVASFHSGVYLTLDVCGNVLITITKTGGANAVLSGLFLDPMAPATTTGVTSSLNPSTSGQSVTFTATVSDTSGGVPTGSVEFYDGSTDLGPGSALSGSGTSATSTFTTSTLTAGSHSISAVYTPTGNFAGSSGSLTQTVNSPPATASFNGKDSTTEGSWIGVYGSQGYNVINATNGVNYPSYATVTPAGNTAYTWAANTNALPALEIPPSGTSRIAAAWYASTSFTVDVNLTDGQSHNIELYLLDYNTTAAASRSSSPMPTPMPSWILETVSSFHTGVYLSWTISGNVLITITNNGRCQRGPERTVLRPDDDEARVRSGRQPHCGAGRCDRSLHSTGEPIRSARSTHHPLRSPLCRPPLFCPRTTRRSWAVGSVPPATR